MNILQIAMVVVVLTSSIGCSQTQDSANSTIIYYGGDIITMETDKPEYVDAVVTQGGKIVFAGNKAEAFKQFEAKSVKRDLNGKTLIPAFIDIHSHISATATKLGTIALDAPPAGDTTSIEDIITKMSAYLKENPDKYRRESDWLIGWGLDNGMLKEDRFPTRKDLDKISADVPIVLVHFSLHILVMNTKGMQRAGYLDADFTIPEGVQSDNLDEKPLILIVARQGRCLTRL